MQNIVTVMSYDFHHIVIYYTYLRQHFLVIALCTVTEKRGSSIGAVI